jgi:hypothetical protein
MQEIGRWARIRNSEIYILKKDLKSWMIWKLENYDVRVTSWEWKKKGSPPQKKDS